MNKSFKDAIVQAFRVFDTYRTATITPNSLKLLIRAFGFCVSQQEVYREILQGKQRLGRINNVHEYDMDEIGEGIDLELVLNIMEEKYNRDYDTQSEMRINFHIFDQENKGYIQLSDLARVLTELKQESKTLGMDGTLESETCRVLEEFKVTDDQLKAMIEEFDIDQDSVINFSEFQKIMEF